MTGAEPNTVELAFMVSFPLFSSMVAFAVMGLVVRFLLDNVKPDPKKLEKLHRDAQRHPRRLRVGVDPTGRVFTLSVLDGAAQPGASSSDEPGLPGPIDPGGRLRAKAIAAERARRSNHRRATERTDRKLR